MTADPHRILYLGGTLPTRSETFVSREILALRERGLDVRVASVHPPETDLGEDDLDALAREAICVYGPGCPRLLWDAFLEALRHPARTVLTLTLCAMDALLQPREECPRRSRILWQGLAALALARRVRKNDLDHIHAHMAHVPTTIAMYCARQLNTSFSFTGHAVDLFQHRTLLRAKLERAAFTACISEWHRWFYQGFASIPARRLPIVRCGVDVETFSSPPVAPDVSSRSRSEPVQMLAVGRLVRKKGFDVLLAALAEWGEKDPAVFCSIVGDGPERAALEAIISDRHLEDRVCLLGALSNTKVRELMQKSDLFVLPCRIDANGDRDGIPVVLIEAMACGVCTVSGDLPTIRELIESGQNGILVEPDDAKGLTAVLRSLARNTKRRGVLGATGRERVVEEFDLAPNVDRLVRMFDGVLDPSGGGDGSSWDDSADGARSIRTEAA